MLATLLVIASLFTQTYLVPSNASDPCKRFDGRAFLIQAGANPASIRQRSDENDLPLKEWEYDDATQVVSFTVPPNVMVTHPKSRESAHLPGSNENNGQFTLTCVSPPFPGDETPAVIVINRPLNPEDGERILGGEWSQTGPTSLKREKGDTVVFIVPDDTFVTVPARARVYLPGYVVEADQFFIFSTS